MEVRIQPELARGLKAAAGAGSRAPREGARASALSAADLAGRRQVYQLLVAENAASAAPTVSPPRAAQSTRARAPRRDCKARVVPGRCRPRLRTRSGGSRPSAKPAPRPRQRRLLQRAAIGPTGRQRQAQTILSDIRSTAGRARARRFASWGRHLLPIRDRDPVRPRPRTLPIGFSFAGCTGPLKKGTPAAWVPTACALAGPDMGTA